MSDKSEKVNVHVKYKDLEKQITAEPEQAWILLNQFFKKSIPLFEIANKLWLSVDIQQLARDLDGIVAFSSDGASLLAPKNKLTDNETLAVWLAAYYLGFKLGLVPSDLLSKDELQIKLGKSSKITSTRLGELVKNDLVAKVDGEKFRITVFGVCQMQKEIIPRIKSKINI